MDPGATTYALGIQAADLGRAQHHDAVHVRLVVALGEQHGIAQHVVFVISKVLKDLGPVLAIAVDLGSPEAPAFQDVPEFLGRLDQWKEDNSLAVHAHLDHLICNGLQVGVQGGAQLAGAVVACALFDACDVDFQGDGQGFDGAQVAVTDGLGQGVLIGQAIKVGAQVPKVAPVRGGGNA